MASKPTSRASVPENDLLANVRHSTETAVAVVRHIERSLEQGGFRAGLPAYEQLVETLAGQRLWSLDKEDEQIERNFRELADAAGRARSMLAPYARIMERLLALGARPGDTPAATPTDADGDPSLTPDQQTVVAALSGATEAVTVTALRARTGLPSSRLRTALEQLETAGTVQVIGPSHRPRYRWIGRTGVPAASGE